MDTENDLSPNTKRDPTVVALVSVIVLSALTSNVALLTHWPDGKSNLVFLQLALYILLAAGWCWVLSRLSHQFFKNYSPTPKPSVAKPLDIDSVDRQIQPFRRRLARYLNVEESEVLMPRGRAISMMPFWARAPLIAHSGALKTAAYIRLLLERIRTAVHG